MNESDKKVVKKMIDYVEEKEREIQAAKLGKGSKTQAVTAIIKELERQIKNAN